VLLPRAIELIGPRHEALAQLAADAGLPITEVQRVWRASGGLDLRPALNLTTTDPAHGATPV